MAKKVFLPAMAGGVFLLTLVNSSGFGIAYNTEYLGYIFIGIISFYYLGGRVKYRAELERGIGLPLIVLGGYSFTYSFFVNNVEHAMGFLAPFLVTYLFSNWRISEKEGLSTSRVLLFASVGLLLLHNLTSYFSGWNENEIAMMILFAYFVFSGFHIYRQETNKVLLILITLLVIWQMSTTNSRTSIMCMLFLLIIMIWPKQWEKVVRSPMGRRIIVFYSLICAAIVVLIGQSYLKQVLDLWSYRNSMKPFFNGRDTLWERGLNSLISTWGLGTGYFQKVNWHNWSISILSTYGLIGYGAWVAIIFQIFKKCQFYLDDYIIKGLMTAFLLILIQQATELGLVSQSNVNLLPYMILGMLQGRIKSLELGMDVRIK